MDRASPHIRARTGARPSWHKAVALSLLAALTLAGCGGDDDDSATPAVPGVDSESSESTPEETPESFTAPSPSEAPATAEAPEAAPTAAPEAPASAVGAAPAPAAKPAAGKASAPKNTASASSSGSAGTPGPSAAPASGQSAPKPGSAAAAPAPGQPAPAPGAAPAPGGGGGATDVGVAPNEIKIGMLSELSGPIAIYGQSFPKVVQAFFRDRNERGGIHGRKLTLTVYDDAWDPVRGKAAAKRLIEQDKVFLICCTQSLNTNAALTPYMDEVKVPMIGVDGLNEEQYKGRYTFPIGTSLAPLAELWAPYAYNKLGARKAAIASLTVSGGPQFRDIFKKEFEKLGGEVVYEQDFDIDEADFTSFVLQARSKGADVVTGFLEIVTSIRMMQAADQQGWKPAKGYAWNTASYVNVLPEYIGEYANDITFVQNHLLGYETPSPGLDEFNAIVGKYFDLKDLTYSPWLALAGVAAKLTMDAIDAQGPNLTREGVVTWLEGLTGWDTKWGIKLTFRPGTGDARRSNTGAQFLQVKDGKFVPLGGIVEAPSYRKAG